MMCVNFRSSAYLFGNLSEVLQEISATTISRRAICNGFISAQGMKLAGPACTEAMRGAEEAERRERAEGNAGGV